MTVLLKNRQIYIKALKQWKNFAIIINRYIFKRIVKYSERGNYGREIT